MDGGSLKDAFAWLNQLASIQRHLHTSPLPHLTPLLFYSVSFLPGSKLGPTEGVYTERGTPENQPEPGPPGLNITAERGTLKEDSCSA